MTIAVETHQRFPDQGLTFEEFLETCPEDGRYELIDGRLVSPVTQTLATRLHDDIADFIADQMKEQVRTYDLTCSDSVDLEESQFRYKLQAFQ